MLNAHITSRLPCQQDAELVCFVILHRVSSSQKSCSRLGSERNALFLVILSLDTDIPQKDDPGLVLLA